MAFEVVLVENKLRPLIFGNIFRNIQKIKNGLRPSSVNYVDSKPPRLPLSGNSARKAPWGEALEQGKI